MLTKKFSRSRSTFIAPSAKIICAFYQGLGIRSFAHRSFRSNQMSDCERFAQIAQDK